jgi:hypothetical protein
MEKQDLSVIPCPFGRLGVAHPGVLLKTHACVSVCNPQVKVVLVKLWPRGLNPVLHERACA